MKVKFDSENIIYNIFEGYNIEDEKVNKDFKKIEKYFNDTLFELPDNLMLLVRNPNTFIYVDRFMPEWFFEKYDMGDHAIYHILNVCVYKEYIELELVSIEDGETLEEYKFYQK